MAIPQPKRNVPRDRVDDVVKLFLQNPEVADIECTENGDGTYDVTPHARDG